MKNKKADFNKISLSFDYILDFPSQKEIQDYSGDRLPNFLLYFVPY